MTFLPPRLRYSSAMVLGIGAGLVLLALIGASPALAQRYTVQEAGLDGGGGRVAGGSWTLTSSLGGGGVGGQVQTGRYVLFGGLPSPFAGQAAILIVHDPETGGGAAAGGTDRSVTARIIANNAPLDSTTLYYRSGRADQATAVPMTEDETGFVATIPGADIGVAGLTYYFVATDEQGATVRAPRSGVYSLPVQLGGEGPRKPGGQTGGSSQNAYRLLSMPIDLDDPSPEAVLGDDISTLAAPSAYDPTTARLFEPIGTRVAEYPRTGDFELGRAFWLIVREEVETIDAGAGTSRVLNEPVRIALSRGWNFIGTPFAVDVPVANVRTTSGAPVTLRSYGTDGYNTPDSPVTAMTPFGGYAVFVESPTTLVVEPPLPEAERAAKAATASAQQSNGASVPWRLRIRGSSRTGRDADNVAAVHAAAADAWDPHDWPEPPALASGLSIAFDGPDGAPAGVTLSVDARPEPAQGTTWPLTVTTEAAGPVRLSVDGVQQVPAAFEAWLLDLTTKDTWNLRQTPQARLTVLSDGAERSLRLIVGTNAYVSKQLRTLEAVPATFALEPPYPNPSSGPVAFRVGLPQDDEVTIRVYNVLGQRVATLRDETPMTAGFHTVVWAAPHLASGLYFVRLQTGDYRKTQKLVRVR